MPFHTDTLVGKLTIILVLLGARELVRLFSPKPVADVTPNLRGGAAEAINKGDDTSKWLIETLDSAAIAIGLVLFVIQPFLLQAFYIPSGSMEDTLQWRPVGDRLLVSKLVYRLRDPRFQEIVVFKAPPEAIRESSSSAVESNPAEETDFIKRCIGTPGDVVYAENGKYYHNGQLIQEPYAKWSPGGSNFYDMKIVDKEIYSREYNSMGMAGPWNHYGQAIPEEDQQRITEARPGKVPPGMFLMLGDHRSNSLDSHFWGFVPRANVLGKAIAIFWPPTRLGLLEHLSFQKHTPQTQIEAQ
ncbi:MAG: signal peptidase I [Abitibacteriaceae bacterium]|nr:signal peptidase I [Abditibacteriaceae bacterium]